MAFKLISQPKDQLFNFSHKPAVDIVMETCSCGVLKMANSPCAFCSRHYRFIEVPWNPQTTITKTTTIGDVSQSTTTQWPCPISSTGISFG